MKAGTKRSSGVSDMSKVEREKGRGSEREENEILFYSSRKYKLAMYTFDSLGCTYLFFKTITRMHN